MSTSPSTARRDFLGQLATGAAALAGAGCARASAPVAAAPATAPTPAATASAPAPSVAAGGPPDAEAWVRRIVGRHKAVFDAPAIADGVVIMNAYVYLMGFGDVYKLKDNDLSAVLVIRHAAIPMAFTDAMWEKYDFGRFAKLKAPDSKQGKGGKKGQQWVRRNLFWKAPADDPAQAPFTLDALAQRGAILIGCALAAGRLGRETASRTKQDPAVVQAELRAHLVPGLELAPSGIFAVLRAQEAGCGYVRST